MKIMVSGTPGTGKTEVSAILAEKLKYQLIKINDFAYDNDLIVGQDEKRGSLLIDTTALESLIKKIKEDCVIEGHLAHFLKANIVFVLRTNPDTLKKRLKKRNWLVDKIDENLEAEILDVCLQEAVDKNKNVYEIDTTKKTPTETMKIILKIIKKDKNEIKNAKPGNISWNTHLNALTE
ncbi:AAA family ATPase [archaeon]|nr:AAA family ATPase [archaeon]